MVNKLAQAYSFLNYDNTQAKPRVAISACLCGDLVRYDGRNKNFPELISSLEEQLDLLKICPEVAIGMGVPRAPIQLTRDNNNIEARGVENSANNVTSQLQSYASSLIKTYNPSSVGAAGLCGFIFKSRSPSCGVGSTPIYKNDIEVDFGSGVFAQQIQQQWPWLPVTEETDLLKPHQQNHFVLLTQLVQLFISTKATNNAGLMSYHRRIADIQVQLSGSLQAQLEQLASEPAPQKPYDYLTLLIRALRNP